MQQDGARLAHIPVLDGLRGLAVLLVILAHTLTVRDPMGAVGVTIFFVLSGYLITTLLLLEHRRTGSINRRRFYARRARRLLPALAVLLAVDLVARLATGGSALPTAIAAVYATNISLAAGHDVPLLAHTWSLSLEEQFYALWPLLLPLVMRRRPVHFLLLAALGSVVARGLLFAFAPWHVSYFSPLTRADALLIGCALAVALHRGWRVPRAGLIAALAGSALAFSNLATGRSAAVLVIGPAAVCAALVIAWAAARPSGVAAGALSSAPLRFVGRISYGLYLWHPIVITLSSGFDRTVMMVLTFVGSFSLAAVSWFVIERPILLNAQPMPRQAVSGEINAVAKG